MSVPEKSTHEVLSGYIETSINRDAVEQQWRQDSRDVANTFHEDEFPIVIFHKGMVFILNGPTDPPEQATYISE